MLKIISKVLQTNFKVLETVLKLPTTNFKVLQTIFNVLKTNFNVLETNLKLQKLKMTKILVVLSVWQVNGFAVLNNQHFEVAKNFREIDPRRGVGWVLIVKGVILICNIGRDKSELRNMKNQNFEFPSAGTEKIITLPKAKIDQLPPISGKKEPFQKLGSRMDAPDIDLNWRFSTSLAPPAPPLQCWEERKIFGDLARRICM